MMTRRRSRSLLTVLFAVAACGGAAGDPDGAGGPDAYRGDGASTDDAPQVDASHVVTVTVYNEVGGVLLANTPVVFHSADGEVQIVKVTDDGGQTSENVGADWSVTAVVTPWTVENPYPWIQTVMGVQGGEHLVFGNADVPSTFDLLGSMVVQPPGAPTTASRYVMTSIGCNSYGHDGGDSPVTMDVYSACPSPLDFITTSYDNNTGTITHYAYTTGVPFSSGGTVTQPTPWHSDFNSTTLTLSNVPSGLTGVSLNSAGRLPGAHHGLDGTNVDLSAVTSASASLRTYRGFPASHQITLSAYGNIGGSSAIAWFLASAPSTLPVDLTAALLPFITNTTISGRAVTFTKSLGTATADVMVAKVSFYEKPVSGNWDIFAPGGAAALTLPVMPTDLGATFPTATASYYGNVGELEYSGWADYTATLPALGGHFLNGVIANLGEGVVKSSINDRR